MNKPMSPTDYKILVICGDSNLGTPVRKIFSVLASQFDTHLNYGYLCNKCSALADLGWLKKISKSYGNRKGSMKGRPSFYSTTSLGTNMTKKYHRWKIVNERKRSGSSNNNLKNYL